jgi:hypothetical protein
MLALTYCALASASPAAEQQVVHHEAASMPVTHDKTTLMAAPQALTLEAGGIATQFGGFVKLDAMQDFDPIGVEDQFKVNSVPVSSDPDSQLGGSSHMTARATRLTLDVRSNDGPSTGLRAYVEGDFYGSGNAFRIRHGYGEWRGLLAGTTWSTFQDFSARPFTLDYEGTDGEVLVRQALIRYTQKQSDSLQWSVAVENADSELFVTQGVNGSGRSEVPDLAGALRFSNERGHVQVAGLLRQLRFVSEGGELDESDTAFGINLSGSARVVSNDTLMGHLVYGSGIGRYIESFGGTNSDAIIRANGSLDALNATAATLGYTHHWSQRLNSTLSGSIAELDTVATQPANAIKSTRSAHLNLVYKPIPQFLIGGELMWGERENNDGDSGDALRMQVSVQYNFR